MNNVLHVCVSFLVVVLIGTWLLNDILGFFLHKHL